MLEMLEGLDTRLNSKQDTCTVYTCTSCQIFSNMPHVKFHALESTIAPHTSQKGAQEHVVPTHHRAGVVVHGPKYQLAVNEKQLKDGDLGVASHPDVNGKPQRGICTTRSLTKKKLIN